MMGEVEIILIKPQLNIIQGNDTYEKLSEIYKIKEEKIPERYMANKDFPNYRKIYIPVKSDPINLEEQYNIVDFVKIFHTSSSYRGDWKNKGQIKKFF